MALSASSAAAFALHNRLLLLQAERGGEALAISHRDVHFEIDSKPVNPDAAKRRELGRGRFGNVWAAQLHSPVAASSESASRSTPIPVAVKAVKRLSSESPDPQVVIRDLESELNAMWQLRGCAHIVQLHGYCVYPAPAHTDEYHLIMERMGMNLENYMKLHTHSTPPEPGRIYITWLQRVSWCLQLCLGTASAHAKGINHDLKPGNCLLSEDGQTLKLGDFGLAHIKKELDATTTLGRHAGGTTRFMSPEQWRFHHFKQVFAAKELRAGIDKSRTKGFHRRVDVWAIGCCMQQIFSGDPPFKCILPDLLKSACVGRQCDLEPCINELLDDCPPHIRPRIQQLIRACMQVANPPASELARELQFIIQMQMEGGEALLQSLRIPLLPANSESSFVASSYKSPPDSSFNFRSLRLGLGVELAPSPAPTMLSAASDLMWALSLVGGFVATTAWTVASHVGSISNAIISANSHTRAASVSNPSQRSAASAAESSDTVVFSYSDSNSAGGGEGDFVQHQQQQHGRASSSSLASLSSMPPLAATVTGEYDESQYSTPQPKRLKSSSAAAAIAAAAATAAALSDPTSSRAASRAASRFAPSFSSSSTSSSSSSSVASSAHSSAIIFSGGAVATATSVVEEEAENEDGDGDEEMRSGSNLSRHTRASMCMSPRSRQPHARATRTTRSPAAAAISSSNAAALAAAVAASYGAAPAPAASSRPRGRRPPCVEAFIDASLLSAGPASTGPDSAPVANTNTDSSSNSNNSNSKAAKTNKRARSGGAGH